MQLCAVEDITINNKIQKPVHRGPSGQEGANLSVTGADRWGHDYTSSAMARINVGAEGSTIRETEEMERGYG